MSSASRRNGPENTGSSTRNSCSWGAVSVTVGSGSRTVGPAGAPVPAWSGRSGRCGPCYRRSQGPSIIPRPVTGTSEAAPPRSKPTYPVADGHDEAADRAGEDEEHDQHEQGEVLLEAEEDLLGPGRQVPVDHAALVHPRDGDDVEGRHHHVHLEARGHQVPDLSAGGEPPERAEHEGQADGRQDPR